LVGKRKPSIGDLSVALHDLMCDPGRLASIVESSDDAILSKGLDGTILTWNRGAQRLFGYRPKEAIGKPGSLLIPPGKIDDEKMILDRVLAGQRIDHYETVRRRKDGSLVDVSITVSPVRDAAGRIIGVSKIARDIGSAKQVQAALRDSEQRLRAIVENAVDAIITIDEHGIIDSANPATERLFGYDRTELIGKNVKLLMPQPYREEHDEYVHNYLRTGKARIIGIGREVTGLRKDGATFPLNLSVSELRLEGRRMFTGIIHDLSSRRLLERQIIEASVAEQQRIGQDLHDGLCQDLIGIAFQCEFAARQLDQELPAKAASIRELAASVREAAGQARRLSHGLNPVNVGSGGLPTALEALALRISDSFKVNCTLRHDPLAEVGEDMAATHLYRIAQEAVSNAIKHGKARNIEIQLAATAGRVTLSVRDDGIGMAKALRPMPTGSPPPAFPASSGIGMHTMRYRANMIGAVLEVRPHPRGGILVSCTLPIECSNGAKTRRRGKTRA
jgi:PAS domain S-box-containing protein